MQDASKIREKIRALLAKTTANGATEAEALSAAAKARELMDAHNVTVSETDARENGARIDYSASVGARDLIIAACMPIARFTDCEAWRTENFATFCGAPLDVEFALYLFESIRRTRDAELTRWRASVEGRAARAKGEFTSEQINRAFTAGFVTRIRERLDELTRARKTAQSAAGSRALVAAKNALIETAMREAGIRTITGKPKSVKNVADANAAGASAGDRASFGRPVSGASAAGAARLR